MNNRQGDTIDSFTLIEVQYRLLPLLKTLKQHDPRGRIFYAKASFRFIELLV